MTFWETYIICVYYFVDPGPQYHNIIDQSNDKIRRDVYFMPDQSVLSDFFKW